MFLKTSTLSKSIEHEQCEVSKVTVDNVNETYENNTDRDSRNDTKDKGVIDDINFVLNVSTSTNIEESDTFWHSSINGDKDKDVIDFNLKPSTSIHIDEAGTFCNFPTDVAHWNMKEEALALQNYWSRNGSFINNAFKSIVNNSLLCKWHILCFAWPSMCCNFECDFKSMRNDNNRCFSLAYTKRTLLNGDNIHRDWVVFSPSTQSVFCFVSKLFENSDMSSEFVNDGFKDWKNATRRLKYHENPAKHQNNNLTYLLRSKNIKTQTLDSSLNNQINKEEDYWRNVLRRVISIVKFLGRRGLPFRRTNQEFGSNQNGNFLGVLEVLCEYDLFLKSHIDNYGNQGKGIHDTCDRNVLNILDYLYVNSDCSNSSSFTISGRASYLSANIYEEIINLVAQKMLQKIINEVKRSKYFSISVDSTPDISHVDQLVFCIQYVNEGTPMERFLKFINIKDVVNNFLDSLGINIKHCRGQSYDNASNMAGAYSGLQAKIIELNNLATFIPCAAHSLHLVGTNTVSSIPKVQKFFNFIENLY